MHDGRRIQRMKNQEDRAQIFLFLNIGITLYRFASFFCIVFRLIGSMIASFVQLRMRGISCDESRAHEQTLYERLKEGVADAGIRP